MADEFTTLCIKSLKEKLEEEFPNYDWCTEQTLKNTESRISVDIYGENDRSIIILEFEMYRRRPDNNASKLFDFKEILMRKKVIIIHVFSPFYEVKPHYRRAKFCETILPEQFRQRNINYATFRWNLSKFPDVHKKCQNPDVDFPPEKDIQKAITTLARALKEIIVKWEIEEST